MKAVASPSKHIKSDIDFLASTDAASSWEVHYDLVMSLDSAMMSFSLELDGETMGSVDAHFSD